MEYHENIYIHTSNPATRIFLKCETNTEIMSMWVIYAIPTLRYILRPLTKSMTFSKCTL